MKLWKVNKHVQNSENDIKAQEMLSHIAKHLRNEPTKMYVNKLDITMYILKSF